MAACALPCAEASAAPVLDPQLPIPSVEAKVARAAQARTVRALATRRQRVRARTARSAGVVEVARAQIGDGYAWGASGPGAFDCSGLTAFAYARAGVTLPHSSYAQAAVGRPVARGDIRPGDLVFFSTAGPGPSHVGIATSARTVVSATDAGVMEHAIDDAYWGGHYAAARRVG
jgi:cell wall-associated NlpC family hydrolase